MGEGASFALGPPAHGRGGLVRLATTEAPTARARGPPSLWATEALAARAGGPPLLLNHRGPRRMGKGAFALGS